MTLFLILQTALSALAFSNAEAPAQVCTNYSDAHDMVTLVIGVEPPDVNRGVPALRFRDEDGAEVRVYAIRPITLPSARAQLVKCKEGRARGEERRRRRAERDQ